MEKRIQETLLSRSYELTGLLQGVGFRPTVYRLATACEVFGYVQNRSAGVRLLVQGGASKLDSFLARLKEELPKQAKLDSIRLLSEEPISESQALSTFEIKESEMEDAYEISFPADLRTCPSCLAELFNPEDRRYGYAFTTCTDCGPRYTVIEGMPYDRERSTLREFSLCPECRKEYTDPSGRRFHAESTACPTCGPKLQIFDANGKAQDLESLSLARRLLSSGKILAIRGIGGFLLAVDAFNKKAIQTLREKKKRPHKPFAVMARDIDVMRRYCFVSEEAEKLLKSPEAPIVILDLKNEAKEHIPLHELSPDTETLGVMLPYSPLHYLLFYPLKGDGISAFDLLVMTSGNRRSEPICIKNDEVFDRLACIADAFLVHDREINFRADDSLCALQDRTPQVWRRARGYAPNSLSTKFAIQKTCIGMGAELKNTIALGYANNIVLSPHIGDLETPEAISGLEQVLSCFPDFFRKKPERVLVDLHPDMHSSVMGRRYAKEHDLEVIEVQHHFAHALSIMAEHGLDECIALVFDGTGLGTDGHIWGAESLYARRNGYKRLGTFSPVPLPGGDAAVLEPKRQVIARFIEAGIDINKKWQEQLRITDEEVQAWKIQISKKINAPLSHAAGRLFDSVATFLGIAPERVTYDGQAAIRLEAFSRMCLKNPSVSVPFSHREEGEMLIINWQEAFRYFTDLDWTRVAKEEIALAFHYAVKDACVLMIEYAISQSQTSKLPIALSGGVFMNRILSKLLMDSLTKSGHQVFLHQSIPPNDGGISAGQVYYCQTEAASEENW